MIMNNKTLILLCDQYPLSAGEFFIDDEMRVIAPKFDKVLVYTTSADSGKNLNRFVPGNAEVISFSSQKLESVKLKSILRIFTPMFIAEFFFALKKLSLKYWLSAFKIMYVDMHRATNLKKELWALCKEKNIFMADGVFYSYWHDYKALALAMLRKDNSNLKCVARAHRWDNFADSQRYGYLPFKYFIIDNLSLTITISEHGKRSFTDYLGMSLDFKVEVSKLGKFNERWPNMNFSEDRILICSCSSIYYVKQVNRIIDVISCLPYKNVHWIHFGSGPMYEEMKQYAQQKLENVYYEFRGIVANNEILDFYKDNYVDLFLNLSSSEGIPVSIMEALSAGIPVVATDAGGTSEAVNEKVGFLVPLNFDCKEVAEIIKKYLNLSIWEQQSYRKNAYRYWQENYDAATNYRMFYDILEKL